MVTSSNSENFFFPPLQKILSAFRDTWMSNNGAAEIVPSLLRLAAGFFAAFTFALTAGVLLGSSKVARDYTEPVFEFFRPLAPKERLDFLAPANELSAIAPLRVG